MLTSALPDRPNPERDHPVSRPLRQTRRWRSGTISTRDVLNGQTAPQGYLPPDDLLYLKIDTPAVRQEIHIRADFP